MKTENKSQIMIELSICGDSGYTSYVIWKSDSESQVIKGRQVID